MEKKENIIFLYFFQNFEISKSRQFEALEAVLRHFGLQIRSLRLEILPGDIS